MLKNYKKSLLISSILILLPLMAGLLYWNVLPQRLGGSGKLFTVFGMPLLLLGIHWLCMLFTVKDPKNETQSPKVLGLIFWIVPMLSFFVNGVMYAALSGKTVYISTITFLLMGVLFIVIGNFMPKCRQNSTIGIKLKWTLESEENWNATHRVAGKTWTIGGFLFMALVFLPELYLLPGLLIAIGVLVVIPTVYSYRYHKRQVAEGATFTPYKPSKQHKLALRISLIFLPLLLIGVAVLMFTGQVSVRCEATKLQVEATYWEDLTVPYEDIDRVEYRPEGVSGNRIYGFGSARLLLGLFENKEFGTYTRYSYGENNGAVVLWVGEEIIVLGGDSPKETEAIYRSLQQKGVGK